MKLIFPVSGYTDPSENRTRTVSWSPAFFFSAVRSMPRNSRWLTGKTTYIGSRLTIVVSTPESGPTTLPLVTLDRPTSPVIGDVISV